MKLKYFVSMLSVAAVLFSSCASNRDNNLPGPGLYFINSGLVPSDPIYTSDIAPTSGIRVYRSGYGGQTVTASVRFSEEVLTAYNEEHNTTLELLPKDTYQIENKILTLSNDNRTGTFDVIFDVEKLEAQFTTFEEMKGYVIPLELVADGTVDNERKTVLIWPDMNEVMLSLDQAATRFFVNGGPMPESENLTVSIARTFREDIEIGLDMTQQAMDAYNAAHHTSFVLPPAGFAALGQTVLVLEKGQTSVSTTLNIDRSNWSGLPCAVPVRLISDEFMVNPEKEFLLLHISPASDEFEMYGMPDRYDWKIDGRFYHGTTGSGSNAIPTLWRIIDGVVQSFWDGPYNSGAIGNPNGGAMPIDFTIDFGSVQTICGAGIRNRDGSYCDRLKSGYIEVSEDGVNWGRVADFGFLKNTDGYNNTRPDIDYKYWFEPTRARYMRVTITGSNAPNGNYQQASLGEMYAYVPAQTSYKPFSRLSQTGWSADANSYQNTNVLSRLIDGNTNNTHWEAGYNASAATPANLKLPFTIQIDMSSVQSIDGIEMWRRNTIGLNESIFGLKEGTIWVSETATDVDWKTSTAWQTSGEWMKAGEFNFENNASMLVGPYYYMLPAATNARYVRIHITDSNNKNSTRDTAAIGEIFAIAK
jgi:hypothetical protein